jgi:hypothetical protein
LQREDDRTAKRLFQRSFKRFPALLPLECFMRLARQWPQNLLANNHITLDPDIPCPHANSLN